MAALSAGYLLQPSVFERCTIGCEGGVRGVMHDGIIVIIISPQAGGERTVASLLAK